MKVRALFDKTRQAVLIRGRGGGGDEVVKLVQLNVLLFIPNLCGQLPPSPPMSQPIDALMKV